MFGLGVAKELWRLMRSTWWSLMNLLMMCRLLVTWYRCQIILTCMVKWPGGQYTSCHWWARTPWCRLEEFVRASRPGGWRHLWRCRRAVAPGCPWGPGPTARGFVWFDGMQDSTVNCRPANYYACRLVSTLFSSRIRDYYTLNWNQ